MRKMMVDERVKKLFYSMYPKRKGERQHTYNNRVLSGLILKGMIFDNISQFKRERSLVSVFENKKNISRLAELGIFNDEVLDIIFNSQGFINEKAYQED